mmetsp:Transcript_18059/g.30807  ORF Transcript_18059/g.30807 Transcript_18059/m.30807 type:complete len:100 (+) Transcript_18059:174-473(+)
MKTLNSNNPQAPHNLCYFSFKERIFKGQEDYVDQLVFHLQIDGSIILKDSEEASNQNEYKENKEQMNKKLLQEMNKAIQDHENEGEKMDERSIKKSLRN